jgi:hypothetical protein
MSRRSDAERIADIREAITRIQKTWTRDERGLDEPDVGAGSRGSPATWT